MSLKDRFLNYFFPKPVWDRPENSKSDEPLEIGEGFVFKNANEEAEKIIPWRLNDKYLWSLANDIYTYLYREHRFDAPSLVEVYRDVLSLRITDQDFFVGFTFCYPFKEEKLQVEMCPVNITPYHFEVKIYETYKYTQEQKEHAKRVIIEQKYGSKDLVIDQKYKDLPGISKMSYGFHDDTPKKVFRYINRAVEEACDDNFLDKYYKKAE